MIIENTHSTHRTLMYYLSRNDSLNKCQSLCSGCLSKKKELSLITKYYNCGYMCSKCWDKYHKIKKEWYLR